MSLRFAALWCGLLATALSHAAEPAMPPVAAFIDDPAFIQPKISPDGRTLALIAAQESTRYFALIDLQTMQATVDTTFSDQPLYNFWWKGNDQLLVHLYWWMRVSTFRTLNLTTKKVGVPHTFNRITAQLRDALPGDPDHVLVSTGLNTGVDLRLFNTRTFEFKVLEENPGYAIQWFYNQKLEAVAALGLRDDKWFLFTRPRPGAPWSRSEQGDRIRPDFSPIGVHADQRRIIGWDNLSTDTTRIVARDPQTGETEVLFHRTDLDPETVQFWGSQPGQVRAVTWSEDREQIQYFSAADQALGKSIEAALPGATNYIVSSSADESRLIIESRAESRPERYYFLDRGTNRLVALGSRSDALLRYQLGTGRHFKFKARDGVAASARILFPPGVSEPKALPVVVVAPANLSARTSADFNLFTQLLASRGYAVLQVNHRGVEGFGQRFAELGNESIHSSMADDLVDALDHAVSQGWVDGTRACALGEGGGGLLPLYAISRNPGKFKAWVNFDTPMSRAPLSTSTLSFGLTPTWGRQTSVADRRRLRAYNLQLEPLPVASAITLPSFHVYSAVSLGSYDGGKLQKALEKSGAPARFFKPRGSNEWSSILKELIRQQNDETVRCWTAMLEFLQQNLGQPAAATAAAGGP